ncbi:hypothetical protein ScPMuIL_000240 [Solemya velum]
MYKKNNTDALLQKASAQLRGEFVRKNEDDNELDAYINSLTRKTVERKSVNFEDGGDIYISSDLEDLSLQSTPRPTSVLTGSKFLKKPSSASPPLSNTSKFLKKSRTSSVDQASSSKFLRKPQMAVVSNDGVLPQNSSKKASTRPIVKNKAQMLLAGQRSNLPNQASAVPTIKAATVPTMKAAVGPTRGKVKPRSTAISNVYSFETDSDDSMSMSMSRSASSRLEMRSSSSDSFKIGRDGNKFLKKKEELPGKKSPETQPKKKIETTASEPKKSKFVSRSSLKYPTNVVLTSEEESLAEFMEKLERADSSKQKQKTSLPDKLIQNEKIDSKPKSPPLKRSPSPDAKPPVARRTPSPSPRTPTPRRSGSPQIQRRSPKPRYSRSWSSSEDSNFGDSIVSEVVEHEVDGRSVSSEEDFKVNLMDIDSLEPFMDLQPVSTKKDMTPEIKDKSKSEKKSKGTEKQHHHHDNKKKEKPKSKNKTDDLFASFGLQTVDDLLGATVDDDRQSISSEDSELKTEYSELIKPAKVTSDIFHSKSKLDAKNADVFGSNHRAEMSSLFNSSHRDKLDVFNTKHKHESVISELESEIKTQNTTTPRVVSYTEDFEESIDEKVGVSSHPTSRRSLRKKDKKLKQEETDDEYSEDFTDDRSSVHSDLSTDSGSERSYADSYTSQSQSYTYSERSLTRRSEPRKHVETRSVIIQTGEEAGLHFQWGTASVSSGYPLLGPHYGLSFVEPTPIATHVVGADALEAMTSYSPGMLALHDMMKQQLQLTREFVQAQQFMYHSLMSSVESKFQYTTLQDTKEYIRKNKKRKLTFEEALKLVENEMDS